MVLKLCSVSFYLKSSKKNNARSSIYARVIFYRKKAEFAIGEFIDPKEWDNEKGQSKKDIRLNEHLLFIRNEVIEVKRNLERENKIFTAQEIKKVFLDKGTPNQLLLADYFQKYISRIEQLTEDYTKGTVRHYKTTLKHLTAFLKLKKMPGILIQDFNPALVSDFDFFLMTNRNLKLNKALNRNTANKYHTKLKTVLLDAIKNEIITTNPYRSFKLKTQKPKKTFLTETELEEFKNNALGDNASLDRARDLFLFSVYTGLRFSDAQNLRADDIKRDREGKLWIEIDQGKTNEPLNIPMLDPAIRIYEKYESIRELTGYVLPRLTNQKTNTYLKTIADIAGIKKTLTHHVARHTYATTVTLSNGVPLEIVSSMLGHSSLKSTQIYAQITKKYLGKVATELNEKLK
ncbi:MAG: site-specific integrase [Bacteroidetes bacterium]|nr:site-specific integrase [Bacteroidota bacterium]